MASLSCLFTRVIKSKATSSIALMLLLAGVILSGCSKRYTDLPAFVGFPIPDSYNYSVGRFKTSYLAEQINAYFRGNVSGPIGIATFVDLDNLYSTSSFGRVLGEQLISELTMRGYSVVELRRAQTLQIMETQGEFGLSRELPLLKQWHDLSGVVVGTYTASPNRVYVNARLIDPSTSLVLSAGSVEMMKTREIAKLLRTNAMPTSLERIPVKMLGHASFPAPYYWPTPSWNRQPPFNEEEFYPQPSDKASTDLPIPAVPEAPPQPALEPNT